MHRTDSPPPTDLVLFNNQAAHRPFGETKAALALDDAHARPAATEASRRFMSVAQAGAATTDRISAPPARPRRSFDRTRRSSTTASPVATTSEEVRLGRAQTVLVLRDIGQRTRPPAGVVDQVAPHLETQVHVPRKEARHPPALVGVKLRGYADDPHDRLAVQAALSPALRPGQGEGRLRPRYKAQLGFVLIRARSATTPTAGPARAKSARSPAPLATLREAKAGWA